jgi:ABC-type transport system substrate-binding protein
MQEAGYTYDPDGMLITPDGEPFKLTMLATTEGEGVAYAEVLQSQWRNFGVDMEIEPTEAAILYPKITERDYTMAFAQRGGFADASYLHTLFHSSTGGDLPGSFRSAVNDPVTDGYLEDILVQQGNELQETIDEMYCYMAEQAYSVWVSDKYIRLALGPAVQGAVPGPGPVFRDVVWTNAVIADQ